MRSALRLLAAMSCAIAVVVPVPATAASSCKGITLTVHDKTGHEDYGRTFTRAMFEVEVSGCAENDVPLDFRTQNGSAVEPADYTANSGTITLQRGIVESYRVVANVFVWPDGVKEGDEDFFVNFSVRSAEARFAGGVSTAKGVVQDGSPPWRDPAELVLPGTYCWIPMSRFCQPEFRLRAPVSVPVRVRYRTEGGTAVPGRDYVPVTDGVVVIEPGEDQAFVSVTPGKSPAAGAYFLVKVTSVSAGTVVVGTAPVALVAKR